jgi:hypothetical protein
VSRLPVTAPYLAGQWSPLRFAVTNERPALVLALVRSAGLEPAAVAGESEDEAKARGAEWSAYPLYGSRLRELLRAALAAADVAASDACAPRSTSPTTSSTP